MYIKLLDVIKCDTMYIKLFLEKNVYITHMM